MVLFAIPCGPMKPAAYLARRLEGRRYALLPRSDEGAAVALLRGLEWGENQGKSMVVVDLLDIRVCYSLDWEREERWLRLVRVVGAG